MLKKKGKGNKNNAAEPMEMDDIDSMWTSGSLGDSSPEVLLNTVWFLLTLHIGMRGRDEHYKLTYGDFCIHSTPDGFKYVEILMKEIPRHVQVKQMQVANSNPKCGTPQQYLSVSLTYF